MDINDREDIFELNELENIYNFENTSFETIITIIIGFIESKVLEKSLLEKLNISDDDQAILLGFLDEAKKFTRNEITCDALKKARVLAWEFHDDAAIGTAKRALARILVSALYDSEAAEFDTYGPAAIFETFFSCLLDLGDGYCRLFVKHVAEMQENKP